MNHPDVDRSIAIDLIRFLNQPMLAVQIRELRTLYKDFQKSTEILMLLESLAAMREAFGREPVTVSGSRSEHLKREDLQLVCFDFISGG